LHSLLEEVAYLTFHLRAAFVGFGARYGRTLIQVVRYTVTIRVKRTTAGIYTSIRLFGCSRTLVKVVGYTITIGIKRTAIFINLSVSLNRSIGTAVYIVRYTITICVKRPTY